MRSFQATGKWEITAHILKMPVDCRKKGVSNLLNSDLCVGPTYDFNPNRSDWYDLCC